MAIVARRLFLYSEGKILGGGGGGGGGPPPPPPPTIFYSDPDPEVTSVDGTVANLELFQTWAQIRDGPGTSAIDTATGLRIYIRVSGAASPANFYHCHRGIMLFDLSVGLGLTVVSAQFHLWGTFKDDDEGKLPAANIFTSNPVSNIALIPADYNTIGVIPLATEIGYNAFAINAWNVFTLNAAGLALINAALAGDGIVKLAFRESKYDAPNINPFPGLKSRIIRLQGEDTDAAVPAERPYLEVVWA